MVKKKIMGNEDLQQFIYDLNGSKLRTQIMKMCLKTSNAKGIYRWMGTIRFTEGMPDLQKTKLLGSLQGKISRCSFDTIFLFTLSYLYEGNRIHYIAVTYDKKTKTVVIFDSGYNLYPVGKTILIPLVKRMFLSLSSKILFFEKTSCQSSKYGVQLKKDTKRHIKLNNDSHRDAFCQSWSLFFLMCYVRYQGDLNYFEKWCQLKSNQRLEYLIQNFVIPVINSNRYLFQKYWKLEYHLQQELGMKLWKLKT
jgi:hypothetical protein